MNNKAIIFLKNFAYTFSSNLISIVISAIVILIVPKLIGVKEYGYWQLYLFYSTYVGFLQFGWNDGVYLRYCGRRYKELNKDLFFSQFWMEVLLQLVISIIIFAGAMIFINDDNRIYILEMTALCSLLINSRYMLIFILQGTSRIKEYSQIIMIEKIFYCCLILLCLIIGIRQYKLMILADLIGKSISFVYSMYCCRDIVFRNISSFYFGVKETIENINVGIKLMFANIAGTLIIGIVRFGIERTWDVSTFGRVSLTLSISNLMMIFINAVGIIVLPILRKKETKKLSSIYEIMRTFLVTLLIGILVIYYPLRVILSAWLPQYTESLMYMALIFPMCVYEGKMSLLINTFLKSLRKEKFILFVNVLSVVFSLITTFIFIFLLKNLTLSVVSIVLLLALRCVLAEIFLSKILNIKLYKDIILEALMTVSFILTGWFIGSWLGIVIYLLSYATYLFIKRNNISDTFKNVKKLVRE
ncbi:hypothetical protein [Clostridium beijerinckii]|uniref:hypothetical protein n=1 Tax=Clostridium beijerinckii TaxID=1520 RepID=UPI001360DC8C|nr:hypothetical protein [Clostridium beijerinckii]MZK52741.1 hypothetical protein [Clostridium beijerinckii]MZK60848.1 hypothetical protein [Clostridium beijerinckii]MZK71054.1 hypothetical protein [Clostridium beijerinckii]MZK76381.1 hypothetical protein [Clostridium beijerinckii]MZK86113.1 hypothetical protein [Clostridium beijerinckii]